MPSAQEIRRADQLEQLLRDTERRVGRPMTFIPLPVAPDGSCNLVMAEVDAHGNPVVSGVWICDPQDKAAMEALKRRLAR